jgi:hypothetical protein
MQFFKALVAVAIATLAKAAPIRNYIDFLMEQLLELTSICRTATDQGVCIRCGMVTEP